MTASVFYLDVEPSELLGKRGAADPAAECVTRTRAGSDKLRGVLYSTPEAPTDPFAAMAREMGVTLQSPQEVRERRQVQARFRWMDRGET